jgi:hypothetical protein
MATKVNEILTAPEHEPKDAPACPEADQAALVSSDRTPDLWIFSAPFGGFPMPVLAKPPQAGFLPADRPSMDRPLTLH